jgi:DNA-binding ferritin-like protein (Dps family)
LALKPTDQNQLSIKKDNIIQDLVKNYLGPLRRAGKYVYEPTGNEWETKVFPDSKFRTFEKHNYEIKVERSIDEVVGNLFSMSWASKNLLGRHADEFEQTLRQKLNRVVKDDRFVDNVNFSMYILRKIEA